MTLRCFLHNHGNIAAEQKEARSRDYVLLLFMTAQQTQTIDPILNRFWTTVVDGMSASKQR